MPYGIVADPVNKIDPSGQESLGDLSMAMAIMSVLAAAYDTYRYINVSTPEEKARYLLFIGIDMLSLFTPYIGPKLRIAASGGEAIALSSSMSTSLTRKLLELRVAQEVLNMILMANKTDIKQIKDVSQKYNIDARDFGDFIETEKPKYGKRPNDHYTWKELTQLAKEFVEHYGAKSN